ncbi:DeoR family transcriptional regulator [Pseudomonas sp. SJZ079]|uniref:DeoR family transcriptional regulator n=1 Tax=Pseudomonas sp. SJZ079 TaxID=2572887 RepID=UPI00119BED70|nr:DeoR family transcriptional regulator [Pseudomonas sp. SJZ079]TWC28036.1 DeoR family transcriptional regulator [Pseudomonas sp. SJZ079]
MPLSPRHKDIIELVREQGYVSIEELAQALSVTPQTIRRDLTYLAECKLLRRYHGGAAHDSSIENTAYSMRARQWHEEKERIAQAVAAQVPDHASLFITIGTTTEAIARALLNHRGLKVITNNMHVATTLGAKGDFEVFLVGGKVRADGGLVGESTLDVIRQFKVDYALVGISGIDEDGCLLDFDFHESRATLAIMENARKVFLAADSSKFGRNAMVRLCSITQVHQLFTDKVPDGSLSQLLSNHKVALTVA